MPKGGVVVPGAASAPPGGRTRGKDREEPLEWDQSGGQAPPPAAVVSEDWLRVTRPDGAEVLFKRGEALPDWAVPTTSPTTEPDGI